MLQIKFITKWVKLAFFSSALLLVNGMTWLVTSSNQKAGLYPVDADSIGIPLMSTVCASLLVVPIFFVISLRPNKVFLLLSKLLGIARLTAARVGLVLLYACAFLFAAYGFVYWNFPNHYLIAVSYFVLLVVLLVGLFFDWREGEKTEKGTVVLNEKNDNTGGK